MYVGTQTTMPTQSAAKSQADHVRAESGVGAKSSLIKAGSGLRSMGILSRVERSRREGVAIVSRGDEGALAIAAGPILILVSTPIPSYHLSMDISSRDFEAQPSLFLRRAEAGETIVVTDHGRPIAELRPAQAPLASEEAALLELVRSGMVTPPARPKGSASSAIRVAGPPISQAIVEDRQDRF